METLADCPSGQGRAGVWWSVVRDLWTSVLREHWDTWVGDMRGWEMGSLARDARRVVRGLMRTPGFALVVLLTLGVGIGATTSIF